MGDDATTPIYLDIHSGALIMRGGEVCCLMASGSARRQRFLDRHRRSAGDEPELRDRLVVEPVEGGGAADGEHADDASGESRGDLGRQVAAW